MDQMASNAVGYEMVSQLSSSLRRHQAGESENLIGPVRKECIVNSQTYSDLLKRYLIPYLNNLSQNQRRNAIFVRPTSQKIF